MPFVPNAFSVSERIAQNVLAAVSGVTVANGFTMDLVEVERAKTREEAIDPKDLKTVIWQHPTRPPENRRAPWGQIEWADIYEICVFARLPKLSTTPVDQKLNAIRCDVERTLMADPRRGGLCFEDNRLGDPIVTNDPETKIYSIRTLLLCNYRTVRSDPRVLAPAATNEQLFQGGATLFIAPYVSRQTLGPWQRFSDLKITPQVEPVTASAKDDRDGVSFPVDEDIVEFKDRYEIDTDSISPQLLQWRLRGGQTQSISRVSTPLTNVAHFGASPDSVVLLQDASKEPIYAATSVELVTSADGSVTYVANSDYIADAGSLGQGFIKIPPTSSIPANSTLLISLTPVAMTGRPSFDVAVACHQRVRTRIVWDASDGQRIVHGDFDASLLAQTVTVDPDEPQQTKLFLNVLSDDSDRRVGRMIIPAGPLPTTGY